MELVHNEDILWDSCWIYISIELACRGHLVTNLTFEDIILMQTGDIKQCNNDRIKVHVFGWYLLKKEKLRDWNPDINLGQLKELKLLKWKYEAYHVDCCSTSLNRKLWNESSACVLKKDQQSRKERKLNIGSLRWAPKSIPSSQREWHLEQEIGFLLHQI